MPGTNCSAKTSMRLLPTTCHAADVGFNSDDNEAAWITATSSKVFGKRSKTQLARDIISAIADQIDD